MLSYLRHIAQQGLTIVMVMVLLNNSVNVDDTLLGRGSASMDNEIESFLELLLTSINADWTFDDAPEGQDEKQHVSVVKALYMQKVAVPDFNGRMLSTEDIIFYLSIYQGLSTSPLTPPPLA
ncbi:hypothetical protein [Persicobacter psychrovividus]|uniref:Uncharacterized protein n=1 Tax=Persicobacter psychrovividus TaxID=387638 RepID=A0ABN6LDN3_9BACT|nr:hypothetical protein PEPS_33360 [Persicobacter psychrovividus]